MATCDACGGRVNDVVVVCPHCGAKREGVKPTYTKAEIHALIATDEALRSQGDSFGLIKSLVAPHKHSHGVARIAELVLTGLTLPAVLIGAIGVVGFRGARARNALLSTTGELLPVFVMTLLGGTTMWWLLGADYAAVAITAMWARAAIRITSAGRHERSLHAPSPPPAFPTARAVPRAPTTPPSPIAPARVSSPGVVAPTITPPSREAEADEPPGDAPRFLR